MLSVSIVSASDNTTQSLNNLEGSLDNILVEDCDENVLQEDSGNVLVEDSDENVLQSNSDDNILTRTYYPVLNAQYVIANYGQSFIVHTEIKDKADIQPYTISWDKNITINIKGHKFSNNITNGRADIVVPAYILGHGEYTASAVFEGGQLNSLSTFEKASTTFGIKIVGNPVFKIDDFNSYFLSKENFEVKVYEKLLTNFPLSHQYVSVYYIDKNGDKRYINTGYTDENGIYKTPINLDVGEYTIGVGASGENTYAKAIISKAPCKISIGDVFSYPNREFSLYARLVDENGRGINFGSAIFDINGKSYYTEVIDGNAYLNLKLSKTGTYTYSVSLNHENYGASMVFSNVFIKSYSVKISAKSNKNVKGQYSTLKVIVKDNKGKKVNNGIVKFIINGKSYKVQVHNGIATKKIKLPKIKTYKYKAIYSSEYSKSATSTSRIVVMKNNVKISTKPYVNFKGQKSILKAIVKNYGEEISYGKVKFTINGKTYNVKVKYGVATKKIKMASGEYKYKAVFVLKNYKSKASKSKIIVKNTPTFTVKNGKYSVKLSYKEYKKLKNKDKRYYMKWTGQYKYETRKYTYHKKVCYAEVDYSYDWSDSSWEYHKDKYRYKKDWKWYGSSYSSYNDGHYVKYFNKYKKRLKKQLKGKFT